MASVYDINYAPAPMLNPGQTAQANYFQQQPQLAANSSSSSLAPTPSAGLGVTPGMSTAQSPLGMNMGTANLVLGGIGTIGNLWAAYQAQKLAKDQFEFQKGVTNTNMANQIQSYNTSLIDRINSRGKMTGDDQSSIDQYIAANSLRDERRK